MRTRRGFTLIEILFVIVIILVLAAIGFPRMKGSYFKARLSGAAREVVGLLRTAQSSAVLREQPTRVVFNPEEDTYLLQVLNEQGKPLEEKKRRERFRRRDKEQPDLAQEAAEIGARRLLVAQLGELVLDQRVRHDMDRVRQ